MWGKIAAIFSVLLALSIGEAHSQTWVNSDIGSPSLAGSSSADEAGNIAVAASGSDIWNSSDQFNFTYQTMSGNGVIIAKVTGLTNTEGWAKAGVMIRESLSADSKNVFLALAAGNGVAGQTRSTTGQSTTQEYASGGNAPVWLKIERISNGFVLSRSSNGTNWQFISSYSVPMNQQVYVGLAVTSHNNNALATATFTNAAITGSGLGSLPSPWVNQDLGSVGSPGFVNFSSGQFETYASGSDIWNSPDSFHYIYQPLVGDGKIEARVTAQQNTDGWAKAGVMVRESLTADSKHGMLGLSPNGVAFQFRQSTGGGGVQNTSTANGSLPIWLSLERKGERLIALRSADGTNWSLVGIGEVSMASQLYVGLAVTSHDNNTLNRSVFDNVTIEVGTVAFPYPWQEGPIGSGNPPGWTDYDDGTFMLYGSGSDIWGSVDAFEYVYQPLNGDGTIVAKVNSVTNTDGWAKTGVMMRETLAAGSKHAMGVVTLSGNVVFQKRQTTDGESGQSGSSGASLPVWLKLQRAGNVFTVSRSSDGTNWTTVASDAIPMATSILAGLPLTSHNNGVLGLAAISDVKLTTPADTDGNGLPDSWENQYFGHIGNDPGAPAPNGNGTILDNYLNGTDPNDFYQGRAPVVTAISGNGQSANAGEFLAQPFVVKITNSGTALANAPVTFIVSSGSGGLASASGSLTTSGTFVVNSGTSGYAQAWYKQSGGAGVASTITAQSGTSSVTFSSQTTLVGGLASHWPFDEGIGTVAGETTGLSVSGTLVNTAGWAQGFDGRSAVTFSGSAPHVTMGTPSNGSLDLGTGSFSISLWVRYANRTLPSGEHYQRVISKGHKGWNAGYLVGIDAAGNIVAGLGSTQIGATGESLLFATATPFNDNRWHHVAIVFDDTSKTAQIFVDGQARPLVKKTGTGGTIQQGTPAILNFSGVTHLTASNSEAPFTAGSYTGAEEFYHGRLDDVRIYRVPLGEPEIEELYNVDSDNDDLPDRWEMETFGNLTHIGSVDSDGDLLTNQQEYEQGSDANDYFDQGGPKVVPVITIVSGANQAAPPNRFLSDPFVLKVTGPNGSPLVNAPVMFSSSFGGLFSTSKETEAFPLVTVRSDSTGTVSVYSVVTEYQGSYPAYIICGPTNGSISARTDFDLPPVAPSEAVAEYIGENQTEIRWQDSSSDEAKFLVSRSAAVNQWQVIATLPAGSTSFTDETGKSGPRYRYRVTSSY